MHLIRAIAIFALFLFVIFNSNKLIGLIQLKEIMSQEEQQKTGVSQLSSPQKQELEKWINAKFILKTQAETPGLTLSQNMQDGSQLEFSDGSIYEIAPSDRSKTTFWLTPVAMTVTESHDPLYPMLLTNTLTGVSVRAKQIQAPTVPPKKTHPL